MDQFFARFLKHTQWYLVEYLTFVTLLLKLMIIKILTLMSFSLFQIYLFLRLCKSYLGLRSFSKNHLLLLLQFSEILFFMQLAYELGFMCLSIYLRSFHRLIESQKDDPCKLFGYLLGFRFECWCRNLFFSKFLLCIRWWKILP